MTIILETDHIVKSFFSLNVLNGVSLKIAEGSITGIIGPNGAGKSTLFNVLSGLYKPDSGHVRFGGQDISGKRPHEIARRGLVRTFQIARGFPNLTVMEGLLVYGREHPGESAISALWRGARIKTYEEEMVERARAVAERLQLTRVLNNYASEISGGQKKLLEIGCALMASPRMVLLDEPMAGVNPSLSNEIGEKILDLNRSGLTLVIIEHDMSWVGKLCDPVIVMAEGRVLTEGKFKGVISDPQVQDVYMGLNA